MSIFDMLISMNNDMKNSVKIFKALGDRNRLRIIKLLQKYDGACVCEICHILGVSQSTTSRHLQVLEEAGLIYAVKEGKWVNYHITGSLNYNGSQQTAAEQVLELVSGWMEQGDEQVDSDRSKIGGCNRESLCNGIKDAKE